MPEIKKPHILVCVLTGFERHMWVNPRLCAALLSIAKDARFDITVSLVEDVRWVDRARNLCVVAARECSADWLVMFDNDIAPPPNVLDILAEANQSGKDVLGLGYAVFSQSGRPELIPADRGLRDGEFRKTGCCGAGVLMVRSKVWESIPGPWFRWVSNDDETSTLKIGEDYFFCELAQRHGFKVWTHSNLAGHLRIINITDVANS